MLQATETSYKAKLRQEAQAIFDQQHTEVFHPFQFKFTTKNEKERKFKNTMLELLFNNYITLQKQRVESLTFGLNIQFEEVDEQEFARLSHDENMSQLLQSVQSYNELMESLQVEDNEILENNPFFVPQIRMNLRNQPFYLELPNSKRIYIRWKSGMKKFFDF
jgi:hypothetical protein